MTFPAKGCAEDDTLDSDSCSGEPPLYFLSVSVPPW
jgi:hypothetical protein